VKVIILCLTFLISLSAWGQPPEVSIDTFTNLKKQESDQKRGFKKLIDGCLEDQKTALGDLLQNDPDFSAIKKRIDEFNSTQNEDQKLFLDFKTRLILSRRKIKKVKSGFPYWYTPSKGPYEFYSPTVDLLTNRGMNKILANKIYNLFSITLTFYKEDSDYCKNNPEFPPKQTLLNALEKVLEMAKEKAEEIRLEESNPSDPSIKQGIKKDGKPFNFDDNNGGGGDGGGTAAKGFKSE
jgi:hypothetical protein